jgi:hypothetical protein
VRCRNVASGAFLTLAFALVLALAGGERADSGGDCPPQSGLPGRGFVGLSTEDVFAHPGSYRACELNRQVASGVGVIRQTFDWKSIEPSREHYRFGYYDRFVQALAEHSIRVLPILFDPPRHRARQARRGTYPPRRYRDLGAFGAVLVRRYGPKGSFWRRHPNVPRLPIRSWQIWNEPNIRVYWPTGPNPGQYVRLLRASARVIKRADPGAEIVTAGLPKSHLGTPVERFVRGMYRAGGRSAFDTLAINPYASRAGGVVAIVRSMRRLMNSHGDRRGNLWVTEFGWSTGGPRSPFRTTEAGQAARVASALAALHRSRQALRLRGAVYYNWRDGRPYPPRFQDFFGLHTGLNDAGGRPKPALRAFAEAAGSLPASRRD